MVFLKRLQSERNENKNWNWKRKDRKRGNSFEQKELFFFLCCFLSNEFFSAPMSFFFSLLHSYFSFENFDTHQKGNQLKLGDEEKNNSEKDIFERRWRAKEKN